MFAIVTALENGIPVNGKIPSKFATDQAAGDLHAQRDEAAAAGPGTTWEVRNDEPIGGKPLTFALATAKSVNTAFALARAQARHRQGAEDDDQDGPAPGHRHSRSSATRPVVTLGATTSTPLTLAASTRRSRPRASTARPTRPVDHHERQEADQAAGPTTASRSSSQDVANGATELLKGIIENGTGTQGQARRRPARRRQDRHHRQPRSSRGSSATPRSSPRPSGSAPPTARTRMKNITPRRRVLPRGLRWHHLGADLEGDHGRRLEDPRQARRDFNEPSGKVLEGDLVSVPSVSGMSVDEATEASRTPASRPTSPAGRSARCPEGTVVYTDPSGRALRGSTIGLYTSLGYVPAPPKPKTTPEAQDDDRRRRAEPDARTPSRPAPSRPADEADADPAYGTAARAPHLPGEGPSAVPRYAGGLTARRAPPSRRRRPGRPRRGRRPRRLDGLHDLAHLRHAGGAGRRRRPGRTSALSSSSPSCAGR